MSTGIVNLSITILSETKTNVNNYGEKMKKNKDPAFLFYPRDFLSGVNLMNYTQRGKYITLLCIQHRKGSIAPSEMLRVANNDEKVLEKFIKKPNGRYFNPRLREEMLKRKKYKKEQEKELFENSEKVAQSLIPQGFSKSINPDKNMLSSFSSPSSFSSLNANGDKENINKERTINDSGTNITIFYSYDSLINTTKKVIEHLNAKCKTRYRSDAAYTIQYIADKLSQGYTEDDFIKVIDNKASDWLNTEYARYLRPSTLFGDKFEEYLNKPKNEFSTFDADEFFQAAVEHSQREMRERWNSKKED